MKLIRLIVASACLMFLGSCATQNSVRPNLPSDTSFNETAGRVDPLFVTLTLETGEKLLFMVDTGCPDTVLDKSLEPKLGKRLGTGKTRWAFFGKRPAGIYAAPKLYLGGTRLLTGDRVKTDDFHGASYSGIPMMGVLGMDCLRHYCIQLDFTTNKMRFLDPDHLENRDLGKAFPLGIFFGCVFTYADLLDMKNLSLRPDTGMYGGVDFMLTPRLFRWELREQKPFGQADTNFILFPKGTNGIAFADKPTGAALLSRIEMSGQTYTNLLFVEAFSMIWLPENIMGLRFFARNLVTFNFPKRTMYLKQTISSPLTNESISINTNTVLAH